VNHLTAIEIPVVETKSVIVMGAGRHTIMGRPSNDEIRNTLIDLTKTGKTMVVPVLIELASGHPFQVIDLNFERAANQDLTFTGMMANGSTLVRVQGFLPNDSLKGWISLVP
jgi:hypothetical protein